MKKYLQDVGTLMRGVHFHMGVSPDWRSHLAIDKMGDWDTHVKLHSGANICTQLCKVVDHTWRFWSTCIYVLMLAHILTKEWDLKRDDWNMHMGLCRGSCVCI